MRAAQTNMAQLDLGFTSAVLAGSDVYLEVGPSVFCLLSSVSPIPKHSCEPQL